MVSRCLCFVFGYLLLQVRFNWVSGGAQLVDQPPNVYGNWNWNLTFHYDKSQPDERGILEFDITQTQFTLDLGTDNNNFTMKFSFVLQPSDPLSNCVLDIVAERKEDYFAWTDMILTYTYRTRPVDMNSSVSLGPNVAKTDRKQKFLTRIGEVYECVSVIPVLFGKDATLRVNAMDFQAFEAVAGAPKNLEREICPRDYKSSVPIAALTGSMFLFLILGVAGIIAINAFIKHRKTKKIN